MKLMTKIFLAFAMGISIFISLLAVSYYAIEDMLAARRLTLHAQQVVEQVHALSIDLLNVETGQRGYAVTGNESFLTPLKHGLHSLQNNYEVLRTLTEDDPAQRALIEQLRSTYQHWLDTVINPLITMRGEVNAGSRSLQDLIDFMNREEDRNQMSIIRSLLSQISERERPILEQRRASLRNLSARARGLILYGGTAGVLICLLLSILTAWSIKRPLAEAVGYAEKVKNGDFSASLAIGASGEIGVLLSALRSMVDKLTSSIARLKEQSELLELAHDAIFVRDLEGKVVYWNRGAEKTYGWRKDEVMGKISNELLQTSFPKPLEDILDELVETGHWEGELSHITKEGRQIVAASRWAVRRDYAGQPSGFLEINRDVTQHKEADRKILSYMKRLETSNSVLQDFAFVASHDLQEPLRKISIFSDLLRIQYSGQLDDEAQSYLDKIQGATDRMKELIESLLVYSRITTRSEPFSEVDLNEVLQEVVQDLEVPISETGASVEISYLPALQADRSQMRRLFQNLLGNALKFHKESEPPRIKVYGELGEDETCRVFVEDNGIGFNEKYLRQIFQPFQRLHGKSSPYKGSGMGLAISRKIVDRHNGRLTAISTEGKGSIFIVTLPRRQSDESSRELFAA